MSPFRHNRSCIDEELTSGGASGTRRSHRRWRVLGVLMVAVALPAAFATSPASASSAPMPLTAAALSTPADEAPAACAKVMEAAVLGASCEMTAKEDLSGQRVALRTRGEDRKDGETARSLDVFVLVIFSYDCTPSNDSPGYWDCTLTAIDIYIFIFGCYVCRDGGTQAPADSGKDEIVHNPSGGTRAHAEFGEVEIVETP